MMAQATVRAGLYDSGVETGGVILHQAIGQEWTWAGQVVTTNLKDVLENWETH